MPIPLNHAKMCAVLLNGAKGDIQLHWDGCFYHVGVSNFDEIPVILREIGTGKSNHVPLIRFDTAGRYPVMVLTRAGANFILENLVDCYSKHEQGALLALARSHGG